jgi:hypothetical protein
MGCLISVFIAIIMHFAAERCDAISRRKRDAAAEAGALTVLRMQAEPKKKCCNFRLGKKKGGDEKSVIQSGFRFD